MAQIAEVEEVSFERLAPNVRYQSGKLDRMTRQITLRWRSIQIIIRVLSFFNS